MLRAVGGVCSQWSWAVHDPPYPGVHRWDGDDGVVGTMPPRRLELRRAR